MKMRKTHAGFSLVEVLVTALILSVVLLGLLRMFFQFSTLTSTTSNLSLATMKAQAKLEEMRGYPYSQMWINFVSGGTPGDVFLMTRASDGFDGSGKIYLDVIQPNLTKVTIVMSWQNQDGRLIGGDNGGGTSANALNGVVDAGEVVDGDGRFLSPELTLVSYIARR